ncbi:MAG: hypothetical protein ABI690_12965 [Chloroflexota bacterium]
MVVPSNEIEMPMQTGLSSRWRGAALFGAIALIAALPLIYLYLHPIPYVFDTTVGQATVHFESSESRLLFPGQCVGLKWDLEGIQAVAINGQGHVGHDTTVTCNTDLLPTMNLTLQDGTTKRFRLAEEKLYTNPVIIGLWILIAGGLAGAAYSLFGTSGVVFILSIILFWPVTRIAMETGTDYVIHLRYQQIVLDTGNLTALPPHPLYYVLGLSGPALFPGGVSLLDSNLLLLLFAYGFGSVALYGLLKSIVGELSGSNLRQVLIYTPLTLSLWCVVPLVTFGNPLNTLIGRPDIPMNMFNNPTQIVVKPFALLAFLGVVKWVSKSPRRGWLAVLGVGAAVAAATLAKPNYTMALMPAAIVLLGFQFIKPIPINRKLLIFGVIVPAIAVLVWQYLRVYAPSAGSTLYTAKQITGLALAPLDLFLTYWQFTIPQLVLGFVASIMFPLAVYLAYFKVAWNYLTLNLAWLIFLGGQAYAYLFIEIGYQGVGNLTWGGRLTLFVLFAVSLGFFLRQNAPAIFTEKRIPRDPRFYLCAGIYLLHVIPYLQFAHVKIP